MARNESFDVVVAKIAEVLLHSSSGSQARTYTTDEVKQLNAGGVSVQATLNNAITTLGEVGHLIVRTCQH